MKIKQLLESAHSIEEYKNKFEGLKLYHGSNNEIPSFIPFKEREGPKDTFYPIHDLISNLSYQRLGVNIRNTMFLSQHEKTAKKYGIINIIAPCDGYRIFSSTKYSDMTIELKLFQVNIKNKLTEIIKEVSGSESDDILTKSSKIIFKISSETFDEVESNLESYIDSVFSDFEVYIDGHQVKDKFVNYYKVLVKSYIDSIIELKTLSDIDKISHGAEFMVYSPNGFVRVS